MKLILAVTGAVLLIISFGYYYNYHTDYDIDLFQYRAVKIAYKNFFQLMDSLFNENRDEEDDQDYWQNFLDEEMAAEEEEIEEIVESTEEISRPSCYTWMELSDLLSHNLQHIKNVSKIVRETPKKIDIKLYSDIEKMTLKTNAFLARFATMNDRLPRYLFATKKILSGMQETLLDIGQLFSNTILKATERIDAEQVITQKMIIVRWAKILQQFEKVIQSKNDAHLECTCELAKKVHDITSNLEHFIKPCANPARRKFQMLIEEASGWMSLTLEMTLLLIVDPKDKKYSKIDAFFDSPKKVGIFFLRIF